MRAPSVVIALILLLCAARAGAETQPLDAAAAMALTKKFLAAPPPGAGWGFALFLGIIVASFVFYAWALRLACRLCGASDVTIRHALLAVVVQLVVGLCVGMLELAGLTLLGFGPAQGGVGVQAAQAGITLFANAFVIQRMGLSDGFLRALVVSVVAPLIAAVVGGAVALAGMFVLGHLAA
jgi:hypothetical protein